MNLTNFDVNIQIVSTDAHGDSIIVRPWSSHYMNEISSYPTYNINISNLDPTSDVNTQLARICTPIVRSTLVKESSAYNTLIDYINASQNKTITVSSSAFDTTQSTGTPDVPVTPANVPEGVTFVV